MTDHIIYASRRDRRRAARKTLARANAASAGRTTAAVLAASGLMVSTGAAANATEDSSESRQSSTVELPISELNVERASYNDAVAVAATPDVELSFDRPVLTSEASPQRIAAEEAAVLEAEAASAAEAEARQEAEATAAAEAQAQQEAEAVAEAQAEQEAQAQQEAEAVAEAQQQSQAQEQSQPTQQSHSRSAQQPQTQAQSQPAQQESRQSSQSNNGASTAGQNERQSAPSGDANSSVVSAAYAAVGSPYKWGGTSPGGFDCSGLINWAYAQAGQGGIPRTTHGMAASLPRVSTPQPGDIVLSNGNSHGAIYIGNGQVISATSSGVRVHGLHEGWHRVTSYHRPG